MAESRIFCFIWGDCHKNLQDFDLGVMMISGIKQGKGGANMSIIKKIKDDFVIRRKLSEGRQLQTQKDLEGAYDCYCRAAELGSTDAMVRIAGLYYSEQFRPVEQSNFMDLFLQGIPAFPWNTVTQKVPDYKSALEWFIKAADLGHGAAACMAGSMMFEGVGGRADKAKGLQYLKIAQKAGIPEARKALCIYEDPPRREFTSEQYEKLLAEFMDAATAGREEAYELYAQLKAGDDVKRARLGYVLTTAQNSGRPGFEPFRTAVAADGIPLVPVCWKRGNWRTFLRVDLNAFDSDDVKIAVSADIGAECIFNASHRLKSVGYAVYRSPEFGWLAEEKHAVLFGIDRNKRLDESVLEEIAENFLLTEAEYLPDNAAFLVECGEKEYSVEIAAIAEEKVEILLRYTVGGSDAVRDYFEPQLISLTEA